MQTIKKSELIVKASIEANQETQLVAEVFDTMVEILREEIEAERRVTILGFGTFEPKLNRERNGVNPATGEKLLIKASKSIKFKAGKSFKDLLN